MTKHKRIAIICVLLICANGIYAQQDTLSFLRQSQTINNRGMLILGTWPVSNITTGAFGMKNSVAVNKYFHQMNLMWNTVNASIAAFALINAIPKDVHQLNKDELFAKHFRYENLFLINAGLDVLHIGAGAFMINRSNFINKHKHLLKGYGSSIIVQGSFLFIFDLIMFGVQYSRRNQLLEHASLNLGFNSISFSLNL